MVQFLENMKESDFPANMHFFTMCSEILCSSYSKVVLIKKTDILIMTIVSKKPCNLAYAVKITKSTVDETLIVARLCNSWSWLEIRNGFVVFIFITIQIWDILKTYDIIHYVPFPYYMTIFRFSYNCLATLFTLIYFTPFI